MYQAAPGIAVVTAIFGLCVTGLLPAAGLQVRKVYDPVVILSIDGLRPDSITAERTPNIFALAQRGAYTWKAQTGDPSQTLPGHASMISGVTPRVHGLMWDEYEPAKGKIKVPTILSVAQEDALLTVMVVGKQKLAHLIPSGGVYVLAARGDDDVANEAVVRAGLRFDILFVHFPSVDEVGHKQHWMSQAYLNQVAQTDRAVGRVLAAVPPRATVILTADHGGAAYQHLLPIPEDILIPWIIAGPGVRRGYALTRNVQITDTAATVAYRMGLTLPPAIAGRPVLEAFEP